MIQKHSGLSTMTHGNTSKTVRFSDSAKVLMMFSFIRSFRFSDSLRNIDVWWNFRISVTTWNVGGVIPPSDLDLEDCLNMKDASDIYVLGYDVNPVLWLKLFIMADFKSLINLSFYHPATGFKKSFLWKQETSSAPKIEVPPWNGTL